MCQRELQMRLTRLQQILTCLPILVEFPTDPAGNATNVSVYPIVSAAVIRNSRTGLSVLLRSNSTADAGMPAAAPMLKPATIMRKKDSESYARAESTS